MRELGGFILEKQLGRGATAQVYLAIRKSDQRKVALKVFHPGLWEQADMRARAVAEVRAVSSLQHPNIVQIIETTWDDDAPAVALEYIDGVSLEEFQGRLPYILPEISVRIVIEILKALELAHSRGVIHRDLKPANILVGNDGRVLVSDFGLAKMVDVSRLTLSGTILGSPDYMSPEQAKGDVIGTKSDLFSVAAILYFLVTGTRPFSRHTPFATLAAVTEAKPEPAQRKNPKLSLELAQIIAHGLAKLPEDRYQSAEEFRKTLENYLISIGLTDEKFQFGSWMRAPADSAVFALKTIAETLIGRTENRIIEQKWTEALESISHLSQVAPESAAIPRLLEVLESGRRKKNRMPLIGTVAAILLMGSIGFFVKKTRQPILMAPPAMAGIAQVAPEVTTPAQAKPEEVVAAIPATPEVVEAPAAPKMVEKVVKKPKVTNTTKIAAVKTGVVRFDVSDDITVFWDGQQVNPHHTIHHEALGPHQLKLLMKGRPPVNSPITVSAEEPTVIRVR